MYIWSSISDKKGSCIVSLTICFSSSIESKAVLRMPSLLWVMTTGQTKASFPTSLGFSVWPLAISLATTFSTAAWMWIGTLWLWVFHVCTNLEIEIKVLHRFIDSEQLKQLTFQPFQHDSSGSVLWFLCSSMAKRELFCASGTIFEHFWFSGRPVVEF